MVYLFALIGLIMGFGIGLGLINVLLRNKTVSEIKQNRAQKTFYGLLVWVFAFIGLIIGIILHNAFYL